MPKRTTEQAIAANRKIKAERIYDVLVKNGITAEHVQGFKEFQWEFAAAL